MLCQYGHSEHCEHQSCEDLRAAIEAVIMGDEGARMRLRNVMAKVP